MLVNISSALRTQPGGSPAPQGFWVSIPVTPACLHRGPRLGMGGWSRGPVGSWAQPRHFLMMPCPRVLEPPPTLGCRAFPAPELQRPLLRGLSSLAWPWSAPVMASHGPHGTPAASPQPSQPAAPLSPRSLPWLWSPYSHGLTPTMGSLSPGSL